MLQSFSAIFQYEKHTYNKQYASLMTGKTQKPYPYKDNTTTSCIHFIEKNVHLTRTEVMPWPLKKTHV